MIEGNKCLLLEGGFKMNEEKRKKENREVLMKCNKKVRQK